MIKTLSKIYQFSGKMQGTMKKAILFSVLHSLFDMMSFGALAMVFSGLTDGFTTSMIWMIFGITLASMLLKIYCSYISDFRQGANWIFYVQRRNGFILEIA